jgi:hypothetical protein
MNLTSSELLKLVLAHPDCPDQVSVRNLIGKFKLSHLMTHLWSHPVVKLAVVVQDNYLEAIGYNTPF